MRDWKEFKDTGLLWFINTILHLFGWEIIIVEMEGELLDVYPVRVDYRGFGEMGNYRGYAKVTKYLQDNIDKLSEEAGVDYDK